MSETSEDIPTTLPPLDISNGLPQFVELLPEQVQPYWHFLDKYPHLQALVISLLFFALAYVIRRYVLHAISKLTARTQSDIDDKLIALLRGPVFYTIAGVGIMISLVSTGLAEDGLYYVIPVLGSLIILSWFGISFPVIALITQSMSRSKRLAMVDDRTEPMVSIIFKILIILIGAYMLLLIWGINPLGLLASAGIAGIAIGFAAKDTLANLFSGFFIIADTPYKIGDYINLDSGERGKVTQIGLRSTRILTRDDIEIIVPNGLIGNAKIINESGGPWTKMRLRLNVQASYDADLEQVCDVLMQVAQQQENVCSYPEPRVRVRAFAANGVNIQLLCWIDQPELRGRILHLLHLDTRKAFREHDLEIPYLKQDIYLHERNLS